MNKEELQKKVSEFDSKLSRHPMSNIELQNTLVDFADMITSELKAEIERLKSELADAKECLAFTITCTTGSEFEEMKYKAKKLLKLV